MGRRRRRRRGEKEEEERERDESRLEWGVQEELQDIFSVFANEGAGEEEQAQLQAALGLDDETTAGLKEIVKTGKFQLKQDVADEALF